MTTSSWGIFLFKYRLAPGCSNQRPQEKYCCSRPGSRLKGNQQLLLWSLGTKPVFKFTIPFFSLLLITDNIFTKLGPGVFYCFLTVSAFVLKFLSLFITATLSFFFFFQESLHLKSSTAILQVIFLMYNKS